MASDAVGRGPIDKEIDETTGDGPKQADLHWDIEGGPEMIDIDRIERVYR